MSVIDNTLAAQVETFNPATPLMQAAQIQQAQASAQEAQFKQKQNELGAEVRGLQPYLNTPEFAGKWAETADKLLQRGVLDPQTHQQWRNTPSPLLMKSIIAKTTDPVLDFRQQEAQREQKNTDREFGFKQETANTAQIQKITGADGAEKLVRIDRKGNPTVIDTNGPAGPAGDTSGLTGDDYLKSLPPARAALIKGIVEGRQAPPPGNPRAPQTIALLNQVAQYEPGFDLSKWSGRVATNKDFSSGQAAKNVTSLNTVIGHLGDLAEKADKLNNFSMTPLNEYIGNPYKNITGSPEVKNFNLARNAVADELAKVFRGSGLSDAETRQWKENISESNSPAQLKGAIQTAIGLMESRLNAMNEQRSRGMGTSLDPQQLLTDKSRATLENVKKWAAGEKLEKPAAASSVSKTQPSRPATKAEYDALAPGTSYIAPDGSSRTKQ